MQKPPHATSIQPAHDVQRWGPLQAALPGRPRLTRYVNLVRIAMADHGLAQVEAAEAVLTAAPAGGVFILNREGPAVRVEDGQGIGHVRVPFFPEFAPELFGEPASQAFTGPEGALAYLRWHWVKHGDADTDLDGCWDPRFAPRAGVFALLASDADRIVMSFAAGVAGSAKPPATAGYVRPFVRKDRPPPEQIASELKQLKASPGKKNTAVLAERYGCDPETIRRDVAKVSKPANPFDQLRPRRLKT